MAKVTDKETGMWAESPTTPEEQLRKDLAHRKEQLSPIPLRPKK